MVATDKAACPGCPNNGLRNLAASTVLLIATAAHAATYSYNNNIDNPGTWTDSNNWLDNTNGNAVTTFPGSGDDVVTPTKFGAAGTSGARTIGSLTFSSSTGWSILASSTAPSFTIQKTLSSGGTGGLTIRGNMPLLISNTGNAATSVTNTGGTLALGSNTSSGRVLTSLTVSSGLTDVQGGTLSVSATTAAFNGGVHINNGAKFLFNQRNNSTSVAFLSSSSGQGNVAADSTVFSGEGTTNFVATLNINGASGTNTFGGVLADSSSTFRITALQKNGNSIQTLSGLNTYTGGTTVSGGTLRADNNSALGTSGVTINGGTLEIASTRTITNNISMSSGVLDVVGTTNTGALSVTGGTVRGTGTVSQGLTVGSTATLAPGESNAGTFNTTSLSLQSGSTYSVDLAADTSDQTIATGVSLGNGTLSIASIAAGLPKGTFFDIIKNTGGSAVSLTGGLGFNNLADGGQFTSNGYTFRIDYDGTAAGAQSGGKDVVLTLVPEPSIAVLGATGLLVLRRRRR